MEEQPPFLLRDELREIGQKKFDFFKLVIYLVIYAYFLFGPAAVCLGQGKTKPLRLDGDRVCEIGKPLSNPAGAASWRSRRRLAHRPDDRRAAHSWSRMDISTSSYQRPSCSTDSR